MQKELSDLENSQLMGQAEVTEWKKGVTRKMRSPKAVVLNPGNTLRTGGAQSFQTHCHPWPPQLLNQSCWRGLGFEYRYLGMQGYVCAQCPSAYNV